MNESRNHWNVQVYLAMAREEKEKSRRMPDCAVRSNGKARGGFAEMLCDFDSTSGMKMMMIQDDVRRGLVFAVISSGSLVIDKN